MRLLLRGSCRRRPLVLAALALVFPPWLASVPSAGRGEVVTDGSLGPEFALGGPDHVIGAELGTRVGANLFHSFARFNVAAGGSATFTGPAAIDHVLARVTGGSPSQIDGLLRSSIESADLYLLNPAGVLFGPGAQLDVDGSFHAASADYVGFAGGERFVAEAEPPRVLAVAAPAAFGFLGGSGEGAPSLSLAGATLEVPAGETLRLVGRDGVRLDGAALGAEGGRVDLAALASAGELVFASSDAPEPLDASGFEALGEVALANGSVADVGGEAPGALFVRAGQLVLEGGSALLARNAGTAPDGGRISLLASDAVRVVGDSRIDASTGARGGGGRIEVTAGSLEVDASRVLSTTSFAGPAQEGEAAGGTIRLAVGELRVRGGEGAPVSAPPAAPVVGLSVETRGSGAAGTLEIEADSIDLADGAALSANTTGGAASGPGGAVRIRAGSMTLRSGGFVNAGTEFASSGDAGSVHIEADSLTVDGATERDDFFPSVVTAGPYFEASGDGGLIEIRARSVRVANGGRIESSSVGTRFGFRPTGGAGQVEIAAESVQIEGWTRFAGRPTGSLVAAATDNEGDAGTVRIEAGSLELLGGGFLTAQGLAGSSGNAGSVEAKADTVFIAGVSPDSPSGIFVHAGSISQPSQSSGGAVRVTARTLEMRGGALISALALRTPGAGGTIEVRATESILLSAEGGPRLDLFKTFFLNEPPPTAIASVTVAGEGKGGMIVLEAPRLTVSEGAAVAASSLGGGGAGDVVLRGERIDIADGAFVDSTTLPLFDAAGGAAGNVSVTATESIAVTGRHAAFGDPSRVASATLGPGASGTVRLEAPRVVLDVGTVATTSLPSTQGESGGAAGAIELRAAELRVAGGGRIDSSSLTAGAAGSIALTASESLTVEGSGSGIASRAGGEGPGGDVVLRAPRIAIASGGEVSAESTPGLQAVRDIFVALVETNIVLEPPAAATGDAGRVGLTANQLELRGGTIRTQAPAADGGDVEITARERVHLRAGEITASVSDGTGGNITIDPIFVILEDGSRIVANAGTGTGGNIRITTDFLFASPDSRIDASSQFGVDGTVEIRAPDTDVTAGLTPLAAELLDAAALLREQCAARAAGAGSFVVRERRGLQAPPDGYIGVPLWPAAGPGAAAGILRASS